MARLTVHVVRAIVMSMKIPKTNVGRWQRKQRESVRFAYQRVKRGWDVRAYWATDSWLAKHLGEILVYTAEHLHGYPANYPGGVDAWKSDMYKHGQALIEYYKDEDHHETGAANAMYWVANNFSSLWD